MQIYDGFKFQLSTAFHLPAKEEENQVLNNMLRNQSTIR